VAVALVEDGKLLLVEHCKGTHRYWLLPGGGLEWGEGAKQAAFRELLEETGVEAEIGHLLLASETVAPDASRHLLHLVFSGRRLRSVAVRPLEEERITDVRWVPLEEVSGLVFHPPIGATLRALGVDGLRYREQDSVFLGNLWVD
jgi:ADP-ribose pyrophosphatase YjhB (NUDIX family)